MKLDNASLRFYCDDTMSLVNFMDFVSNYWLQLKSELHGKGSDTLHVTKIHSNNESVK